MNITERLFSMQDSEYRDFQAKLIPTVLPEQIIGIRMPALRSFAKEIRGTDDAARFMKELPHRYYDENTLHGLLTESRGVYCRAGRTFALC